MDCQNCGRTNAPDARYCASCGVELGAAPAAPAGGGTIPTRGLGDFLREALQVYRSHVWQFVAIAAIPAAANVLANLFFATEEPALALLGGILILASIALSIITAGAIAFGVARHYTRGEVDVVDCLSHAFQVGVFLIAQAIVVTVVVAGMLLVGGILFIVGFLFAWASAWGSSGESEALGAVFIIVGLLLTIPGIVVAIWLGVRWFSGAYAVVIEGKGPIAGLGRSWDLVTGSWWRVFGIGLVFAIVIIAAAMVISIPIGIVGGIAGGEEGAGVVGAIVGGVATVVVTPFAYIAGVLIYFDLRVRKEGFDLDALAAETSRV